MHTYERAYYYEKDREKNEKVLLEPTFELLVLFSPHCFYAGSLFCTNRHWASIRAIIPLFSTLALHSSSSSSSSIYLPESTTTTTIKNSLLPPTRNRVFICSFVTLSTSPTPSSRPLPSEFKALLTKPKRGIPF